MTEHRLLPESQMHEPKGATVANAGEVYVADGAASGVWTPMTGANIPGTITQGWWDYQDTATGVTPIALTAANTQYELTNDGAGTFSNSTYGLSGITDIWDTSTNRFDFANGSVLQLGDTVDIRFDVEVTTTTANTAVDLHIELGVGSGSEYQLDIIPSTTIKTAGTYQLVRWVGYYMGNTTTLNYPARILARADTTGATVKVNGWYIRALKSN